TNKEPAIARNRRMKQPCSRGRDQSVDYWPTFRHPQARCSAPAERAARVLHDAAELVPPRSFPFASSEGVSMTGNRSRSRSCRRPFCSLTLICPAVSRNFSKRAIFIARFLVHFAIDKRDTPGIRPCVSTPITAVRVEDWVLNSANHYHETASHLL